MSDICHDTGTEHCNDERQPQSSRLAHETHLPIPTHKDTTHANAGLGEVTNALVNGSNTMNGTVQAEHLMDQAQKLGERYLLSRNYQQLLQKAIIRADKQFDSNKGSIEQQIRKDEGKLEHLQPSSLKTKNLAVEVQNLSSQLFRERHACVMARVFLAESLRDQGKNNRADKLIHEAVFSIGGTPQEVTAHAEHLQSINEIQLKAKGVKPEEAQKEALATARPLYLLAQHVADVASKSALQMLSDTRQQPSGFMSDSEKKHLIGVAMSPIETRWLYGVVEYNSSSDNKQDLAAAKSYIKESQAKLEELSQLINYVPPSYMGEMPAWVNPLTSVASNFTAPIALYKKLTTGSLNQIEQGDKEITYEQALARSKDLNQAQQMVCDAAAFTVGFGSAGGAAALTTPETLGLGTAPAFLLTRAAAGSLVYNACRLFFGKPLTAGSVTWGAVDGTVGGLDAYFLTAAGGLGASAILKGSLPGAFTYSSAYAVTDYWTGIGKFGVARGFGTNLALGLVAPVALIRPLRLMIGAASVGLFTSGVHTPTDNSNSPNLK